MEEQPFEATERGTRSCPAVPAMYLQAERARWEALDAVDAAERKRLRAANTGLVMSQEKDPIVAGCVTFALLCRTAQALLEALKQTKAALKYHRQQLRRPHLLLLVERTPLDWVERYRSGAGLWRVARDRELCRTAVERLQLHCKRLVHSIQIASTTVAKYRRMLSQSDAAFIMSTLANVVEALDGDVVDSSLSALIWGPVERYAPPGWKQHWLKLLSGGLLAAGALAIAYHNRGVIMELASALQATVTNFWRLRVQAPALDVYKTLRFNERKFQVASPNSLQLEREALSRMVASYLRSRDASLPESLHLDRELSVLRPYYEKAIEGAVTMWWFCSILETPPIDQ